MLERFGFQAHVAYMPVPRCDECKWWQPFDDDLQPATILPDLTPMIEACLEKKLERLGVCTLFECSEGAQVEPTCKLDVMRTNSGEASISTPSDFGCVQWEKRA